MPEPEESAEQWAIGIADRIATGELVQHYLLPGEGAIARDMKQARRGMVLPAADTPAFLRAKAVLDTRDRGPASWISNTDAIALILKALLYEDGTDEDIAIAIEGARYGVDAVRAIEVHDAWITAFLGVRT